MLIAMSTPPRRIDDIIARAAAPDPVPTAIVHPCDAHALGGALQAARAGLIMPILIGPEIKIRAAAEEAGLDISPFELVAVEHSHAAADEACRQVHAWRVAAVMKGSLHTDELLAAVVKAARRRGRRRPPHCPWRRAILRARPARRPRACPA